jgi:choline dehydrogenase-like flavoprotein
MLGQYTANRGHVRLKSPGPHQVPEILFNYMMTKGDHLEMRAAVRHTREIIAQSTFDKFRADGRPPSPKSVPPMRSALSSETATKAPITGPAQAAWARVK